MFKKLAAMFAGLFLAALVLMAGTGIETYDDNTTVKAAIQTKLVDDLTEIFASLAALAAGSGVVVSSDDTATGVLDGKLVAGEGIDFTVNNPASDETMTIDGEDTSATNKGVVELATDAETLTGTDTARATTPANVAAKLADYTKDEDNMASDSASHVASQQSVKAYVDAEITGSTIPGALSRPQFAWVDTDTITIGVGAWELNGIGQVKITAAITFDLGSGGSNAGSDDLAASKWFYIALDYSAIGTSGALVAADFINRNEDNVTPAWSTKGAWYQDTNDRTVFAVLTNGSSQVLEFYHGGNTVFYADEIADITAQDVDNSWVDAESSLTMPVFSTLALVHFVHSAASGTIFSWRPDDQTATTGHRLFNNQGGEGTELVLTDATHLIELYSSVSDASTISGSTAGWKFPVGM